MFTGRGSCKHTSNFFYIMNNNGGLGFLTFACFFVDKYSNLFCKIVILNIKFGFAYLHAYFKHF